MKDKASREESERLRKEFSKYAKVKRCVEFSKVNLKVKVSETGAELDRIRQEQEAFSMEYYSFREMSGKFESMKQQVRFFTQLTHAKGTWVVEV